MKLKEIIDKLSLKVLTDLEDNEVSGVYVSDMLSDVMSKAQAGNLWVTVQTHKNVIAAANLIDVSAVIISQGVEVPRETIDLANRFKVVMLGSDESTFEVVGKLFQAGVK